MHNGFGSGKGFSMSACSSAVQCTTQTVAIFSLLLVGCIGDNSQMCLARAGFSRTTSAGSAALKSSIHKLSGALLDPHEKLVELSHMQNLRFGCMALQCTDEDNNIHASVRKVRNGAK
jgi:hypothetical protein